MQSTHDGAYHQVYLLTLWRETPGAPWRAALRRSGGQERIGFADLEALALYLLRLDDGCVMLPTETIHTPIGPADGDSAEHQHTILRVCENY